MVCLGEKDYQQYRIIKNMINDLYFNVDVKLCPTHREDSGLAMSSRNDLLSEYARNVVAPNIYRILNKSTLEFRRKEDSKVIIARSVEELIASGVERVEYFEILGVDLQLHKNNQSNLRIFVAAYVEGIRLIDNIEI